MRKIEGTNDGGAIIYADNSFVAAMLTPEEVREIAWLYEKNCAAEDVISHFEERGLDVTKFPRSVIVEIAEDVIKLDDKCEPMGEAYWELVEDGIDGYFTKKTEAEKV